MSIREGRIGRMHASYGLKSHWGGGPIGGYTGGPIQEYTKSRVLSVYA